MTASDEILSSKLIYEDSFDRDYLDLKSVLVTMNEKDRLLSGHAFVAQNANRIFQISIDNDAVPCFFVKKAGISFQDELLQIIISSDDLQIDACRKLFENWIFGNLNADEIENLSWNEL